MHPKLMEELAAKRVAYEAGVWPAYHPLWIGICLTLYRSR